METLYATHIDRLDREIGAACERHGYAALIIHSGRLALASRFDDRTVPYRPTPAFAHISPLAEPGAHIVARPGQKIALCRTHAASYWDAAPPEPPSWALAPLEEIAADAPLGSPVAFIGESEKDAAPFAVDAKHINPVALLADIDAIRAIKSPYEIECIAAANRVAAAGHVAIAAMFAQGDHSELDLHFAYLAATGQDDVETPYKGIVALGRNAAVLHHNRYGRQPLGSGGASLLVDAGAQARGYAADITRTHVKTNGDASRRFGELISALDRIQLQTCAAALPGLEYEGLNDRVHRWLGDAVRDLGIATATTDELVDSGFTRALFPHGLGHSLGIQVHDVGCRIKSPTTNNPFLRNTSVITVGQVFTIEPGCYFIESLLAPMRSAPVGKSVDWAMVASLAPYGGVRIEDNIAVLAGETRNLTRDNWPSPP